MILPPIPTKKHWICGGVIPRILGMENYLAAVLFGDEIVINTKTFNLLT